MLAQLTSKHLQPLGSVMKQPQSLTWLPRLQGTLAAQLEHVSPDGECLQPSCRAGTVSQGALLPVQCSLLPWMAHFVESWGKLIFKWGTEAWQCSNRDINGPPT